MSNLVTENPAIIKTLAAELRKSIGVFLDFDIDSFALDYLSRTRATEQLNLFFSEVNRFYSVDFKNKTMMEIGAGVGTLPIVARKDFGIAAFGLEPSGEEFAPFKPISAMLLKENALPGDIITEGVGEAIPCQDASFDLVYSTNVLEHVKDPEKVIREAVRILKPGGFMQFVIPNYFSFWEGHFGLVWPCLLNKRLAKIYVRLMGKDPRYVDSLQLVNYFQIKRIMNSMKGEVDVLDYGLAIFKNRLATGNYSDWGSLKKFRPIINLLQRLKVAVLIANLLTAVGTINPVILTLRKKV